MTNSLCKFLEEFKKMEIPSKYWVGFDIRKVNGLGSFEETLMIVFSVYDNETHKKTSWSTTAALLDKYKLDYIKENIELMIEHLENKRED